MGEKAMPLTPGQAVGLAVVVVIAALFYAVNVLFPLFCPSSPPSAPFSGIGNGSVPVALNIDGQEKGVYFLPPGTTVAGLLRAARVQSPSSRQSQGLLKLRAGQKVLLRTAAPAPVIGRMKAAECLALDLPLDVNRASFSELVLVPGIGEKTAARIVALRERNKGLHSLAELEEIKGIKGKKQAKLRGYLSLGLRGEKGLSVAVPPPTE